MKTGAISKLLAGFFLLCMFQPVNASEARVAYADSVKGVWGTDGKELYPEEWKASWIWRRGEAQGTDLLLLARKQFEYSGKPDQARLFITADSNYELYINGKLLNRGPVRCQPLYQTYDVLDITPEIKSGKNVIAVRALHEGKYASYSTPPRPGLMVQLELSADRKKEYICTNSSWKVTRPENINLAAAPYAETVDFRRGDSGWQEIEFDDSEWADADELVSDRFWPWPQPSRNSLATTLTYPWIKLVPRDIPYLRVTKMKGTDVYETGEITEWDNTPVSEGAHGLIYPDPKKLVSGLEEYRVGSGPIIIKNRYPETVFSSEAINSSYIIFDLGEVVHGYPLIEAEGNPGAVIELLYAPFLLRGKFPLRTDISGRSLTDRITLGKGKTEWSSLERKYMRYLLVNVRNTNSPVKLYFAGLSRDEYPFEQKGSFTVTNDPDVNWLWNAAVNTLKAVSTDAYTDNYRESIQYAQTSYYASRASYAAFGDRFLQRRYLDQIAVMQQSDGILPASAPVSSYRGQRFLDGPIFWVMGLHDYYLYSGDKEFTLKMIPVAEKFLNTMGSWENKDHLIDTPPYPFWVDHSDIERAGANFCLNALYVLAMENMMNTCMAAGLTDKAGELQKRIENVRNSLRSKLWDSEKKLFSDALVEGKLSPKFGEHANSLAIVAHIATKQQADDIMREFTENKGARLVPAVLFMHYPVEALFMSGRGQEAMNMLKSRYAHMQAEGNTLWEDWSLTVTKRYGGFQPHSTSCNIQAENTFIAHSLSRWLLGIQPVKPGMKEVLISCNMSGLKDIKGSMPSPHGNISVNWKETKKNRSLEIDVPGGMTAYLDVNSLNLKASTIVLDGKAINMENGSYKVPAGKHLIIF